MPSRSIKTRVSVLVVVACVALVAVGTIVQLHRLRSDFGAVLAQQQLVLATQVAEDLDDKLQEGLNTLAVVAQRLPVDKVSDPAAVRQFLAEQPVLLVNFDDVLLLDTSGRVVADEPTLAGRAGMDLSQRPAVRAAMGTGRPVISEPLASPLRGEPILSMVVPILDQHGRPHAAIMGVLRLYKENFLGRLATSRLGSSGYFSIVTRTAEPIYVMHPDRARILQPLASDALPRSVLHTSAEETTVDGIDSRGERALFGYHALKSVNWWLVTTLPAKEAFAPIREAEARAISLAVLLVLLISPLSWYLIGRLLAPLSELQRAMSRLRHSDEDFVKLQVSRQDEIGDLANAFNELILERTTRTAELAAMNDASPVGFFRTDRQGGGVYANRTLQKILGITQASIIRDGWTHTIVDGDRQRTIDSWQAAVSRGDPFEARVRAQHADGGLRWLSVQARPIVVKGDLIGYAGTVEDITERSESEEARRMLAAILDSSPDFVAMTDPAGRVRYVNPAAMRIRGVTSREQALGTTIQDHFPPATVQVLVQQALPQAIEHSMWSGETTIWDQDRREVPIHHIVLSGKTPQGRVEYLASVMRDVSASRQAERALRESEQHMRTITDNVPALVSYLDTEQRFQFANRAYRDWLGIEPSGILGKTLLQVYGEQVHALIEPYFKRAIGGEMIVYEREITTRTHVREVQVTQIPDRDEEGRVVGLHVLMGDVTAKKQEERRLMQLAQYDPLTGLLNRAGFERSLDEAMLRCRDSGRKMALMYLDIDHFKRINDTFGHLAGDELLREFARRLRACLRSTDIVCRMGGDEFTLITEQLDHPDHADVVAGKIIAAMHEAFLIEGKSVHTTTSIGVVFYAGGADARDDLIRRADAALYDSKHAGRDRYRIAEPNRAGLS